MSKTFIIAFFIYRDVQQHDFVPFSGHVNNNCHYAYCADGHSIFRLVKGRNSIWRKHYLMTDDIDPQGKRVLFKLYVTAVLFIFRRRSPIQAPRLLRLDYGDPAPGQIRFSTTLPAMMTSFRRAGPVIGSWS